MIFECIKKDGKQLYIIAFSHYTESGKITEEKLECSKEFFEYLMDIVEKGEKYEDMLYIIENIKQDIRKHDDAIQRLEDRNK